MARWKVTISGKGLKQASVEKFARRLRDELGKECSVTVSDDSPPVSRAERFEAAKASLSDGRSELESLKEELESWYENLPENFQNGEKGDQLQTAMDELDSMISDVETAEDHDVEFPAMY